MATIRGSNCNAPQNGTPAGTVKSHVVVLNVSCSGAHTTGLPASPTMDMVIETEMCAHS